MDLYKPYFNRNASEKNLLAVGRISGIIAMVIAVICAPLIGSIDQAFQFIQEYTGMISPGITAIFVLGLFWKRTTSTAALWGCILSIPLSAAIKFLIPGMPFLDQMVLVFLGISGIMVIISLLENSDSRSHGLDLSRKIFKTDRVFNVLSIGVIIILSAIYVLFW